MVSDIKHADTWTRSPHYAWHENKAINPFYKIKLELHAALWMSSLCVFVCRYANKADFLPLSSRSPLICHLLAFCWTEIKVWATIASTKRLLWLRYMWPVLWWHICYMVQRTMLNEFKRWQEKRWKLMKASLRSTLPASTNSSSHITVIPQNRSLKTHSFVLSTCHFHRFKRFVRLLSISSSLLYLLTAVISHYNEYSFSANKALQGGEFH